MPNERPALTMLIIGFSVAGVVILTVIFGHVWWFIKQRFAVTNSSVRF